MTYIRFLLSLSMVALSVGVSLQPLAETENRGTGKGSKPVTTLPSKPSAKGSSKPITTVRPSSLPSAQPSTQPSVNCTDEQEWNSTFFSQVSTFSLCEQFNTTYNQKSPANCETDSPDIVVATEDGQMIVYAVPGYLGLIDLFDAASPLPNGTIPIQGVPTSLVIVTDTGTIVRPRSR